MSYTVLDRAAIMRSFERAAASFDRHAVLVREVRERLVERMAYFDLRVDRLLDLGCATGGSRADLLRHCPGARVVHVDLSLAMLRQLQLNWKGNPTARVCADMAALPFAGRSMPLVFSNLAVAWCTDLPKLFNEVRRVLRPSGLFVFSTFGPDTLKELRKAWEQVDDAVHVHRFEDMHDLGDMLVRAGFRDPVMDREDIIVDYPSALELMRELSGSGSGNVAAERPRGLTGRTRFEAVLEACAQTGAGDRCPANFEIVFGAAFGPAEGQPFRNGQGEVATFPVESLKGRRQRR